MKQQLAQRIMMETERDRAMNAMLDAMERNDESAQQEAMTRLNDVLERELGSAPGRV